MFVALALALAHAGPLDGWENSRWLVNLEETLPVQLPISGPDAQPPVMRAFQIEAVLTCPEVQPAGKKAIYVECTVEEMAMRGTPQAPPGNRLAEYDKAFQGLHQAMKAGHYEIKLKNDGRVQQVDFEAPPKTDPITVEAARALAIDLLSGFSLFREDVPPGAPWDEVNSTVVRAPSQPLGNGKTKIRHTPTVFEGKNLLQSAGGGTFTSNYLSWSAGRVDQIRASAAAGGAYGTRGASAVLVTKTFDAVYNGVAFMGDGNGPFAERIWNVESTPKHDITDMTGVTGTPLWTAGHIRRLGPDEHPKLGDSGLISAPGAKFGDLPEWVPMPTLGG